MNSRMIQGEKSFDRLVYCKKKSAQEKREALCEVGKNLIKGLIA
jgi:hypothetical protein